MGICLKLIVVLVALLSFLFAISYQPVDNGAVPKTMKAIMGVREGVILYQTVPVPVPKQGEVLVKMSYAPVNPSDVYIAFSGNQYGSGLSYPYHTGLEGTGTVVASGGGILPFIYTKLQSPGVAIFENRGSWSEYAIGNPMTFIPHSELLGPSIVNPLTVVGMLEVAKMGSHKTMVHTAANSALGIMLLKSSHHYNVTILCVVRGQKNYDFLISEYGHPKELVLRSDVETFDSDLKDAIARTGATLAFDAVGGEFSEIIYNAMPDISESYVYGSLSGSPPPEELFTKSAPKSFAFYLISNWLDSVGFLKKMQVVLTMRSMWDNELKTEFEHVLNFADEEKTIAAITEYKKHQKGGKIIIKF